MLLEAMCWWLCWRQELQMAAVSFFECRLGRFLDQRKEETKENTIIGFGAGLVGEISMQGGARPAGRGGAALS